MRASLVVVLLLLASVGTASAECSWVLWEQKPFVNLGKPGITTGDWTIASASPTYATCNEAARRRVEKMVDLGNAPTVKRREAYELIGGGFGYTMEFKEHEHSSSSSEFRCFPDTIDARAEGEVARVARSGRPATV